MKNEKIYGPWIKWSGGECPVSPDTEVVVKLRSGAYGKAAPAKRFYWYHDGEHGDIVEYCAAAEQPDLDAAEKLLRDNGYTIIPPVKPLTFKDVVPMTEAPLKQTTYWVLCPFSKGGVKHFYWVDDELDKSALRLRAAYLDKEHALIAARHLFGLKGGEL